MIFVQKKWVKKLFCPNFDGIEASHFQLRKIINVLLFSHKTRHKNEKHCEQIMRNCAKLRKMEKIVRNYEKNWDKIVRNCAKWEKLSEIVRNCAKWENCEKLRKNWEKLEKCEKWGKLREKLGRMGKMILMFWFRSEIEEKIQSRLQNWQDWKCYIMKRDVLDRIDASRFPHVKAVSRHRASGSTARMANRPVPMPSTGATTFSVTASAASTLCSIVNEWYRSWSESDSSQGLRFFSNTSIASALRYTLTTVT